MRKIIALILCCSAVVLTSCGSNSTTDQPTITLDSGSVVPTNPEGESGIIIDGNRITLTSLKEWSTFNYDGNFSDNCLAFLRMFIEGNSQFEEFSTLKVSKWEIIRDPNTYKNDLAFNFTVTESSLDTLPVGTYKTVIKDGIDCYMTFEGEAPNTYSGEKMYMSEASKAIGYYITSYYNWFLPDYGTANKTLPVVNYIVNTYGESNDIMPLDDFNRKVDEIFGFSTNKEEIQNLIITKNGTEYITAFPIGGSAEFVIIDEKVEDETTAITIQFFADCNRFIKSDVVEYYIGKDLKLLGCNVITASEYKPYGLNNKFYNID